MTATQRWTLMQVRLSNMARVFGADGVTDATAIEMRVRKAQEERHAAHEDRNAARKLTTSERKAKQMRKMFDDNACDVHVQVGRPTACSLKQPCFAARSLFFRQSVWNPVLTFSIPE